MDMQKNTGRYNAREEKLQLNRIITCLRENCKSIRDEIAVIIESPYLINGYSTKLLLINRISFRIGVRGIWHVAGMFFELDSKNFAKASEFFYGVK